MWQCAECQQLWDDPAASAHACPSCRSPRVERVTGSSTLSITVDAPPAGAGTAAVDPRFSPPLSRDTLQLPGLVRLPPSAPLRERILSRDPPAQAPPCDYALLEVLGQGGMGEVIAARQVNLDRVLAIKRLNPGLPRHHQERLCSEALITGSLDHPNIIPIYDLGLDQFGRPFFAMKKVRGTSWRERFRSLSEDANLDILLRVCDAVAFAHAQGVIHRDLKPDNVMIGDFGEVLLTDWGLALRYADLQREGGQQEAMASGSPAYMAPEMAYADYPRIGPRSDIYLLGAILFELTMGTPPHPGEDIRSSLVNAAKNLVYPDFKPGELGDIARIAMATDPAKRYGDVGAFQAAIRSLRIHAQSNLLCDSAHASFAEARMADRHDAYARASACYEQALVLWDGNRRAQAGLAKTRRAFAEHALAMGDVDLAASLVGLLERQGPAGKDPLPRLVAAAYGARRTLRRRMRWLAGTAVTASILVLVIAIAAALQSRAEEARLLAALHERDTAELHLAAMEHRAWASVLAEDFTGDRMPAAVHSLKGQWSLKNDRLVAVGPEKALAELAASGAGSLRLSFDQVTDHGVAVYLDVDHSDLPDHPECSRVTVSIARNTCTVLGLAAVLATCPIPPLHPQLPRHVILERDRGLLRVIIDGRPVIADLTGFQTGSPGRARIAISAQAGASIDNLRVDRLDVGEGAATAM